MKTTHFIWISTLLLACLCMGCADSADNDPPADSANTGLRAGDTVRLTIIQTTDVHHTARGVGASATYSANDAIDNSDGADRTRGGYSRLTTQIAKTRLARKAAGIPTLLVDSGDFLMGTVYDLTAESPAGFNFLEFMKYDAVTLGNHEFDYGPAGFAMLMNNARGADGSGFTVPVVATNMVTDGAVGTDDDGIEAFLAAGAIRKNLVVTLDNGLKVGIIGLMGENADEYAPIAGPVMFEHSVAFVQAEVDRLKNELGAHLVLALSHSGVYDPNGEPHGDDITMAQNVTGIDIIVSGHHHERTDSVIKIGNTHIICAGSSGTNLAVLDVSFTVGTGVVGTELANETIDDSIPGDPSMNFVVGKYDAEMDKALGQLMPGLTVNGVIAGTDSDNLGYPERAYESGMGNLVADSLRNLLKPYADMGITWYPPVGIFPNGNIRSGFSMGQGISFADIYATLPLGMTIDPAQQDLPGYPLLMFYFTGKEIKNLCQFAAYVMAADDAAFVAGLPATAAHFTTAAAGARQLAEGLNAGSPNDLQTYNGAVVPLAESGDATAEMAVGAFTQAGGGTAGCVAAGAVYSAATGQAEQAATLCAGLQSALPALNPSYYLNISGIRFTHAGPQGLYQVQSVNAYGINDYQCQYATEPVRDDAHYMCVADLYLLLMMQTSDMQYLLNAFGIPMTPKLAPGRENAITMANVLDARLDAESDISGGKTGVQEVKTWQALLRHITGPASDGSLESMIPDSVYGSAAISSGDSSRVNP